LVTPRMTMELPERGKLDADDHDVLERRMFDATKPFNEGFVDDKVITEREGRQRMRRASPADAYVGSAVVLGAAVLVYAAQARAMEWLGAAPTDMLAMQLTKPAAEAVVLGLGTLTTAIFAVNAVGLLAFGVETQRSASRPLVYFRCDGSDPQCCSGQGKHSYLTNYRGYETPTRAYMDKHLKKRTCCEVAPVIVFPGSKEDAVLAEESR